MSSLIFCTGPEQAFIATDTLATSGSNKGQPFTFTTKAFIAPHLRLIMCGTGAGGFLGRWFVQVNDRIIVRDVNDLDDHATENLAVSWLTYKQSLPVRVPDNLTTTVYHFGFSESDGLLHSYAYRSTSNFQSEKLQYCVGVKPECELPESYTFPNDIKAIMNEQRRIQTTLPIDKRVYIGGEILVHHLTKSGFQVYSLGRFNDYEKDEIAIYENFHSSSSTT